MKFVLKVDSLRYFTEGDDLWVEVMLSLRSPRTAGSRVSLQITEAVRTKLFQLSSVHEVEVSEDDIAIDGRAISE